MQGLHHTLIGAAADAYIVAGFATTHAFVSCCGQIGKATAAVVYGGRHEYTYRCPSRYS